MQCSAAQSESVQLGAVATGWLLWLPWLLFSIAVPPFPLLQLVLGRPVSRSNRGSMIMVNVSANAASSGVGSPRPGTPRLVPKQD